MKNLILINTLVFTQLAFAFDPTSLKSIPEATDSRTQMQSAIDAVSIGQFQGDGLVPNGIPETTAKLSLSTTAALRKAIDEASKKSLGRLVQSHFEDAAKSILANSSEKQEYRLARILISRLVQDVKDSIAVSSNDSEAAAQFYANFYMEGFKLALNYAERYKYKYSNCKPSLSAHKDNGSNCQSDIKPQSTLVIANDYASFLIDQSSAFAISQSAKSVLVIKSLNYYGWDYLSAIENFPDYSNPYNDKVIMAKEIQDGVDHADVVHALKERYEVNPQVLNALRSDIKALIIKK